MPVLTSLQLYQVIAAWLLNISTNTMSNSLDLDALVFV